MPTATVVSNKGFDFHSVIVESRQPLAIWDDVLGTAKPLNTDYEFRMPLGGKYWLAFEGEFNKKFTNGEVENVALFQDKEHLVTFTDFGMPLKQFFQTAIIAGQFTLFGFGVMDALANALLLPESKTDTIAVFGGKGDDVLYYRPSAIGDITYGRLFGRGGNDIMEDDVGMVNKYDGETGRDTVAYFTFKEGVTANLSDATQNKGEAAGDTYRSVENLTGTKFDDVLIGNTLKNELRGEGGNDTLDGGTRADTLYGGDGADTFVFNGPGTTADVKSIMDFDALDHIQLSRTGFGLHPQYQLTVGTTLIMAQANPVATTNSPTFLIDQTTGELFFDADGNGAGEKQLIANVKFVGSEFLQLNDFAIV